MQTMIRASVMLASLAAGIWALAVYRPEETVQPLARRAIEWADEWIGRPAPPVEEMAINLQSPGGFPTTRLVAEPNTDPMANVNAPPLTTLQSVTEMPAATSQFDNSPPILGNNRNTAAVDDVSELLVPLTSLGMQDASISPWGRDGRFHRVSGEMPVGSQSGILRHVEAVAQQPSEAVSDVLRQVEAWRQRDQSLARLR